MERALFSPRSRSVLCGALFLLGSTLLLSGCASSQRAQGVGSTSLSLQTRKFDSSDAALHSSAEWEKQGDRAAQEEQWGGAVHLYKQALISLAMKSPAARSEKKWEKLVGAYEKSLLRDAGNELETLTDWWSDLPLNELMPGYPEDSLPVAPIDPFLILDGYDIPVVINERVWKEVRYFTEVVPSFTRRSLLRKSLYDEMVRNKIDSVEMPRDLAWLAFVESGYMVHALSIAKANGLWQFIPATGKRYGLQVDWWIDERRDPEKSTAAALRYLRDLHKEFGDWLLAMAAYNCGEGRVRRAIRNQGTRDFWELALPKETMHYVPRVLAAAIVGHQQEHWGFKTEQLLMPAIDTFTVEHPIPLSVVGEIVGISADSVSKLNPMLLRWTTPPSLKNFTLRIPEGRRELFAARYAKLDKNKLVRWQHHKVQSGENLGVIARRYGVTVSSLQSANKLRSTLLRIGQDLIIPAPGGGPPVVTASSASKGVQSPSQPLAVSDGVVTVRAGDTYFSLARAFGVTVEELQEVNQATDSRLMVGQKLKLPSSAPSTTLTASPPIAKTKMASAAALQPQSSSRPSAVATAGARHYQVRSGDNPYSISLKLSVDLADLLAWNGLSAGSPIYPGNKLTYYSSGSAPQAVTEGSKSVPVWYAVQSGDTLWDLARRHNTTVEQIREWNKIDHKTLRPGQRIKVGER